MSLCIGPYGPVAGQITTDNWYAGVGWEAVREREWMNEYILMDFNVAFFPEQFIIWHELRNCV